MADFSKPGVLLITCAKAMPSYLCAEIKKLGFRVVAELDAAVQTKGTLKDAMLLNLHLRTAHRVLYMLDEFKAENADQLYENLHELPWEDYVPADGYLCVNCAVLNDTIRDTRFAALKCKDAIVDRIRSVKKMRPDSGSEQDRSVVFLYWRGNDAKIYIDTSGEPLSKRGYRQISLKAPMQETLAGGVLMATGWDGNSNFINPMCGSGTIAIEAALLASNQAPGFLRGNFGFKHVPGFDENAWNNIRAGAEKEIKRAGLPKIIASDIDHEAVLAAKKNAAKAGVAGMIDFRTCDFAETPVPEGDGVVVLNPEYGERLGADKKLEETYFRIGDFFKQKCQGYRGYVFTGNMELGKKVGLRSKRRIIFYNSQIECRLLEFDIYPASKRKPRESADSGGNTAESDQK